MWNYTLLQLGLALGRFPQENTLSLPQSQVSQISASFLPIFIHFHPFHLFSFVFLYCCSFSSIFPPFSFIFRKHSVTPPVPGVSDRSRLFTPTAWKKANTMKLNLKKLFQRWGQASEVVKRNESVIKVWGGRGRRMEETHLSSSCSLWSGERTTSFRLHRSSVGDFLTKNIFHVDFFTY